MSVTEDPPSSGSSALRTFEAFFSARDGSTTKIHTTQSWCLQVHEKKVGHAWPIVCIDSFYTRFFSANSGAISQTHESIDPGTIGARRKEGEEGELKNMKWVFFLIVIHFVITWQNNRDSREISLVSFFQVYYKTIFLISFSALPYIRTDPINAWPK